MTKGKNSHQVNIRNVSKSHIIAAGGDVHIDTGGGDYVGRDKIKSEPSLDEIIGLFETLYRRIESERNLSIQEKALLRTNIKEIQGEIEKGDKANKGFIERRFRTIKKMAPDILSVVVAGLAGMLVKPEMGGWALIMAIKKLAEKIKNEKD